MIRKNSLFFSSNKRINFSHNQKKENKKRKFSAKKRKTGFFFRNIFVVGWKEKKRERERVSEKNTHSIRIRIRS